MLDITKLDDRLFEKLCYQLAYKEFSDKWEFTPIDWSGWDGWVEFFLTLPNWDVRWWQCKFFKNWLKSPQKKQIEESLNRTRLNHKKLKKWILCLPIDLTIDLVQKNGKVRKWARWWFDDFVKKNSDIIIEEWFLSNIDTLLIEYPNIDNAIFNPDPVKRKEALIWTIEHKDNSLIENEVKKNLGGVEGIFVNWIDSDVDWAKNKYLQYNLSKFRLVDIPQLCEDIKKLENDINLHNFNSHIYKDFCVDFQWTISQYFMTYKPYIAELSPVYNYIFSDIWKQVGSIVSIWTNLIWREGGFTLQQKEEIYYMIFNQNE